MTTLWKNCKIDNAAMEEWTEDTIRDLAQFLLELPIDQTLLHNTRLDDIELETDYEETPITSALPECDTVNSW